MSLLLLYGATGVGKSTVLRILQRDFGFSLVRVYTTRPARSAEDGKSSISDSEFDSLLNKGVIFADKKPLGTFRYGESAEDLEASLSKGKPWALDMGIRYFNLYRRFRPVDVVLDPDTPEALLRQLTVAKRLDRLSAAQADIVEIDKMTTLVGLQALLRVRNETGRPEIAAQTCAALVQEAAGDRP